MAGTASDFDRSVVHYRGVAVTITRCPLERGSRSIAKRLLLRLTKFTKHHLEISAVLCFLMPVLPHFSKEQNGEHEQQR